MSGVRAAALAVLLLPSGAARAEIRPAGAPTRPQPQTVEVHDPYTGKSLGPAAPRSVIVQFDPAAGPATRAAAHAAAGAVDERGLGAPGLYAVTLPAADPDAALKRYAASAGVRVVSPNRLYRVLRTPDDPLQSLQYGLSQINAYGAWDFEVGASSPVTVAVMDTGVEKTHEDLSAHYDAARSRTFCPSVSDCGVAACAADPGVDNFAHGTRVAGVAAAAGNNAKGIAGVSWQAPVVSLKVFDDNGCASDATLIAALNYAVTLATTTGRRTVVNMSLGSCNPGDATSCGDCSAGLAAAVSAALADNAVLVAAAGNQGSSNPRRFVECPAKLPGVVAVGATDSLQSIASFSGEGPEMADHGVVAPGVSVETTATGNGYADTASGTSFSSPHVAGLAALMLSANPSLSASQVLAHLRNTAELIGPATLGAVRPAGNAQGAGRVNARSAVLAAQGKSVFSSAAGGDKPVIFPNPFRPSETPTATIVLPPSLKSGFKGIRIYTMDGRLVRRLVGQSWDGKNDGGVPVATGTYLVLVDRDGGAATGKVAVVR